MLATAELAGFFAAHAVWSVSDGVTLTPILGIEGPAGTRELRRLGADELSEAVGQGKKWLAENPERVARAVLVYDAFMTLESGRTDALMIEARRFVPESFAFTMAIPYTPPKGRAPFAVHKPKLLHVTAAEDDIDDLIEAFFNGVGQHEQGADIWDRHLDERL